MSGAESHYSLLDKPEILMFLFHPRPQPEGEFTSGEELIIPVDSNISVGARYYHASRDAPTLLFFHGNGEIVADYEDLGPVFVRLGLNFFPVDYRGYGRSTGSPSVSAMMQDSLPIFRFFTQFLSERNNSGPVLIMGRSLGSAPALELASHYDDEIDGLVIESGFAHLIPLMQLLGIDPGRLGITSDPIKNMEKIKNYTGPTLIIHAEHDHIIPHRDGEDLFAASGDAEKVMLTIPGANHNNIFAYGLQEYLAALRSHALDRCTKQ